MNGAHVHLIVTHLPVLGVAFGTFLLGFGLLRKNRVIQQVALVALVLAGLAAGVAYLTGEGAEEAIEGTVGPGQWLLDRHEDAALVGLVATGMAGALALAVLASGLKGRPLAKGLTVFTLVVGLSASGTLAWVANLGGQLGHPEIRTDQPAPEAQKHQVGESP